MQQILHIIQIIKEFPYNVIYEKLDIPKEKSTVHINIYEPIKEIKNLYIDEYDKPEYIDTIFEGKKDNINTFYKIMYWNFNYFIFF